MSHSIKLIYNPVSRNGKSKSVMENVREVLDEKNIDYGYVETEAPEDGIAKAEEAGEEGYDVVCSIGGDGTAHEVANGAINADLIFALIPAGSGNDFAHSIGLTNDWEEAVNVLLNGRVETLPTVVVENSELTRHSINVAEMGLGGAVVKRSKTSLRWIAGSMKYTLLTLRSLLTHKSYECEITIDGESFISDVNLLAAGFGQSFGSGMRILPSARFNKEKMSIALVHDASRLRILRVFPKIFSGTHIESEFVDILEGTELYVDPLTDRDLLTQADGELVGTAPFRLKAVQDTLNVIIPQDWSLDNEAL